MLVNNNEFTKFGKDWLAGKYSKLPKESYEYQAIWQEQLDRCYNGYSVGGKFMSGSLYGYVNFGTIQKLNATGRGKSAGRPDLRDVEWEIDAQISKALEQKKNLMLVAGRRLGKSFYATWRCAETAIFYRDKALVAAGDGVKLDLAHMMVYDHILGLMGTELYIPLLNSSPSKDLVVGYQRRDPKTKKFVDHKTGGLVYRRNFKDNKTAANGLSTRFAFIEEIGMFDNLIESYEAMKYCWREGNENFGFACLMGTGGDMDKGSIDAAKMFSDPEAYDLLAFHDEQSPERLFGYFVPGYMSFNDFRDEQGNIKREAAIEAEKAEREKLKKSAQPDALYNRMQYSPLTWKEAFLKISANIFPVALIQQQIERIETDISLKNLGSKGYFDIFAGNKVKFVPDNSLFEVEWPVKPAGNNKGCVVIYEHPYLINDSPPHTLYVAGQDPYAEDVAATSPSLGSCIIYKRIFDMNQSYNLVVAEYTGRPATSREFYEQVRRLLIYYNAKCLYESNIKGFKEYMEQMQCLQYIAYTPPELKDVMKDSVAQRVYGVHMSKPVKDYVLGLIRDWLMTQYAEGAFNVEKIYSVNLLKELMNYDDNLNFDRVIAFGLAILKNDSDHAKDAAKLASQGDNNLFAALFERHGWNVKNNNGIISIR